MDYRKFINAAVGKNLTAEMLQEFCQDLSNHEIAIAFGRISINNSFDGYFNGLIREMNNPEIMLIFVESMIPVYTYNYNLHLHKEDVSWIVSGMDLGIGEKILRTYLAKGYKFKNPTIQQMIYKVPQPILFQTLVEYQGISEDLQKSLFTELACSCGDEEARKRQLTKIRAYIMKHKLCKSAEVEMVQRPEEELAEIIDRYAFKWGFCSQVLSGLLWRLVRRIG